MVFDQAQYIRAVFQPAEIKWLKSLAPCAYMRARPRLAEDCCLSFYSNSRRSYQPLDPLKKEGKVKKVW